MALGIYCLPLSAAEFVVRVSDSTSAKPINAVTVTLSRPDGDSFEAETDPQGRATFPELAPGTWRLHAERTSYVDLLDHAGRGRPVAVPVAKSAAVELTRGATVTGEIRDSKGEPFEGAKVIAVARRRAAGTSRLTPIGEPARSDDRGNYRLYGLAPGWYAVAVFPTGEPGDPGFTPVYSDFFELAPGDTLGNVNLVAATSQPASVSGTVSGIPDEEQVAAVALASRGGVPALIAGVLSESGGSFVIHDVPPGEYQLLAWTPAEGRDPGGPPASPTARAASRSISIFGGDLQADLALQPLVKANGRLTIQGDACSSEKEIAFQSGDGWREVWPVAVTVNGDHFTAEGLLAGHYRISVSSLDGSCRLAEVRVGDKVAPGGMVAIDGQSPLTLVLTSATGEISGVVGGADAPTTTGMVILSPADGEGAVQVAQVDAAGRYAFGHVVAGEYLLVARKALDSTNYLDAVESPKLGTKLVTVEAGGKVKCDLKLPSK